MRGKILATLFSLVLMFISGHVSAQGVTSAAIQGTVQDEKGEALIGATVLAVHTPTGSKYGTTTNIEGRFVFPNVQVGGPYTLEVSYVGYDSKMITGINLNLGQKAKFDIVLTEAAKQLETVVVVAEKNAVIDPSRTGAATNITTEQLQTMPTISRSIADFARLTPQFNSTEEGGLSFGGQNNRYNNVMIDGAVSNDVFGLNANGSPGGRTGSQPISLDALKEIKVLLAPFDVRQSGFTGAGVNAVTRSGTNKYEGSVYYYMQNEKIAGKSIPTDLNPERERLNEFVETQQGFRVGGPILKDKLFFFLNGEYTKGISPYNVNLLAPKDSVDAFIRIVKNVYGYDAGNPYEEIQDENDSKKLFVRFDWNINQKHKLNIRNNFLSAFTNDLFRSGSNYSLNTSQYDIQNYTNSLVVELNSNLSSNTNNEFRIGYTRIRDERKPTFGSPDFPQFTYENPDQLLLLGAGRFSALNTLSQDLIELTNNFTWFKGDHTLTFGTRNEFYFFDNLFIESGFGEWTFRNLTELEQGLPVALRKDYSLTDNFRQSAKWRAMQLGLYAQDEWVALPDLTLTIGLRADLPMILDEVARNYNFEESFYLRNDLTPKRNVLLSPRIGFNYNVQGKGETQVRGGVGVFSGRPPFVWLSNQYAKNGIQFGSARFGGNELGAILGDLTEEERIAVISDPYYVPDPSLINRTVEVDITNPNLRLPQVLRTNIAVDQKLPWDLLGTFEAIYSKTMNDIYVRNINLQGVQGQNAHGRNLWGTGPNRPTMVDSRNFTDVYVLENTSQGYQVNLSFTLKKNFEDFYSSLSYNYGISKDIKSSTNSIAGGNWASAAIVQDANNPPLAYSDFDVPHRVVGNIGYTLNEYSKNASTSISLFYSGQSGRRYSYVYRGDVNFDSRDNRTNNDLIFVPASKDQIIFSGNAEKQESQWVAFNAFIENDDYLKSRRGQFAERNAAIAPWRHKFDLAIRQDFKIFVSGKEHKLQVSADIFNVGNMLHKNWGNSYVVSSNSQILIVDGIDPETQLPIVSFRDTYEPYFVSRFGSVWTMQLGARYTF